MPLIFGDPRDPAKPRDLRKVIGDLGEGIAAAYLERNGYRIVARNWRRRGGELDIVAADGPVLSFIEVRTRTSRAYGSAEESVDLRKQRQVRKVAALFLSEAGALLQRSFRFDVLVVNLDRRTGEVREVRHLRNAF